MKKILSVLYIATLLFASCSDEYDDSALTGRVDNLENRVAKLEELCNIIRKSKCSTDFKRNDFLKKNEAYPLGALRSLKFAYRKLRISLFVELAV